MTDELGRKAKFKAEKHKKGGDGAYRLPPLRCLEKF